MPGKTTVSVIPSKKGKTSTRKTKKGEDHKDTKESKHHKDTKTSSKAPTKDPLLRQELRNLDKEIERLSNIRKLKLQLSELES